MLLGESNQAIVRSMIDIGHTLDMRVVADGVDKAETRDALRLLGCDVIQGAVVSQPLSFAELIPLARRAENP
ncbi:MAG: EAL domain-containing protein [Betaproteobacteria bacterium]|nr:EAL domain-containing protein [Betaproteobacteria bacterium]